MDISTGNWFEYLREEVLTEGLRDIGLPESVVDYIETAMPGSIPNLILSSAVRLVSTSSTKVTTNRRLYLVISLKR